MASEAILKITKITDGAELARQIAPKMTSLGNAVAVRMQRLVPKRTWALHDSIEAKPAEVNGAEVTIEIGFGTGYGLFVERGTSKMRAQPFARPALLQSRAGDFNFGGRTTTRGAILETRRVRRAERAYNRRLAREENEAES